MPEENDQKEIKILQARILTLEETIQSLKKGSDDSKSAQSKIVELENQLKAVREEKENLQQRIWDGKNRRAKERRNIPLPEIKKETNDGEDPWAGHF